MKIIIYIEFILLLAFASCTNNKFSNSNEFIKIEGTNLVLPTGDVFFIKGTNLGNWLNPEGYMFGFGKANSAYLINDMFCQLVGPQFTAEFWKKYKDNYITREDIAFIKSTGANTVRLPFHYKLFTDEDYMGSTVAQDGFSRIDSLIKWCKAEDLYLILDMHDAPGGQTGDNIDDSYGYPWLFDNVECQMLFCEIWSRIAHRYKDENRILGYELLNEPIANFFDNTTELNIKLKEIYKKGIKAIRKYDKNHIILLGGAQWNTNFEPLDCDWLDDKIMYTCHRYGGEASEEAIRHYIDFRDKVKRPMYMGEIGHNTHEWQSAYVDILQKNNIGYTFWPYKKLYDSDFVGIVSPKNWDLIMKFAESDRSTYEAIRRNRPSQQISQKAMMDFLEACKFKNCVVQSDYIKSVGLNVDEQRD